MKIPTKVWLLLLCVLISINYCQAKPAADTISRSQLIIGKPITDFTLQTPDGGTIKLSSLKGQVVLFDFWASWCMPCRASIPHLKELYKKYHGLGLEILSVSIDQNSKAWNDALLKEKMPWKQAIDKYNSVMEVSEVMNALGIDAVPFMMILDKDGTVQLINPDVTETDQWLKTIFKF